MRARRPGRRPRAPWRSAHARAHTHPLPSSAPHAAAGGTVEGVVTDAAQEVVRVQYFLSGRSCIKTVGILSGGPGAGTLWGSCITTTVGQARSPQGSRSKSAWASGLTWLEFGRTSQPPAQRGQRRRVRSWPGRTQPVRLGLSNSTFRPCEADSGQIRLVRLPRSPNTKCKVAESPSRRHSSDLRKHPRTHAAQAPHRRFGCTTPQLNRFTGA